MEANCVYCGSPWDLTRDHVIPSSYLREKRRYYGDWLITACNECNSALSDELLFTVPRRAKHVLAKYRAKYKKLFQTPNWDDEELSEVKGNLRKSVEQTLAAKHEAGNRIVHLKGVSFMDDDYRSELCPYLVDGETLESLEAEAKKERDDIDREVIRRWKSPVG